MEFVRFLIFSALFLLFTFIVSNKLNAGGNEDNYNSNLNYNLKDTTIKVVWREDVYDSKLKGSVNVIMLNDNYFKNLSEPEKAVLGYLASTIGNECYADGKSDVKCKLLTALSLGSQCSETNKQFLTNWFKNEPEILKQVENCKPTLPGGNIEKTFDVVKVSTSGNVIKVSINGLKLNIKENSVSSWSENITFKITEDKLYVTERTK